MEEAHRAESPCDNEGKDFVIWYFFFHLDGEVHVVRFPGFREFVVQCNGSSRIIQMPNSFDIAFGCHM